MADIRRPVLRGLLLGASLVALSACSEGIDLDLRDLAGGLDTSEAARQPTEDRPRPDDRGIISYPSFDVAVAKRGDTVESVASRIGIDGGELARFNGLDLGTKLRAGEVLALPERISGSGTTGLPATEEVDITTLAGNALDRVDSSAATVSPPPAVQDGPEPIQHQVVRGETAYSIARLYNVSVRSLADWNGLGPDLTVREGQFLLIPVAKVQSSTLPEPETVPDPEPVSVPGEGSVAPEPPSASNPLPEPDPEPVASEVPKPPVTPADERTEVSAARFSMPVQGSIIRDYEKGVNDGIGISATPGTTVKAAGSGTVAAITRDVDGVPILVLRHSGNLLTVYANIEDVTIEKGDSVSRGQAIATVRGAAPSFLHFEVREGFESVDPIEYLN